MFSQVSGPCLLLKNHISSKYTTHDLKNGDFPLRQSQNVYILPVNFINVYVLITSSLILPLNGLEKALEPLGTASLRHLSPMFLTWENSTVNRSHKPCQSRPWHLSAQQNKGSLQLRRPFLTADSSPPFLRPPFSFFFCFIPTISSNSSRHLKCR